MKQPILFLLVMLTNGFVFGQQSFYIQLSSGYGFSGVNDDLGSPFSEIGLFNINELADSSLTVKTVHGTQGKGVRVGLGPGYMFTPNIGLECQFNFIQSPEIFLGGYESSDYNASHIIKTHRFTITPRLVLQAGNGKLKPYLKAGLVFPVFGSTDSFISISDQEGRLLSSSFAEQLLGTSLPPIDLTNLGLSADINVDIEANSHSKFTLGVQSVIGLAYHLNDHLILSVEFFHETISFPIKNSELRKSKIAIDLELGGFPIEIPVSDLSEMGIINKQIVYVDELTANSNNPAYNNNTNTDQPLEDLEFKNNYNSMGIQLGVSYVF